MRLVDRIRLAILVLPVLASAASAAPPVEWKDWNSGLATASASGRPVVVDVYTDWCRWCKQMDREVYGRADVAQYLSAHFVTVKLNAESGAPVTYHGRNSSARALASSFEVSGYPTTIFLSASGEHLVNVPGYVEPAKFLLLLRYIGDGHMDRGEKWEEYVKQAGGN